MQIPKIITDLNNLGIALKSLEAIKAGTVGVNAANIDAYGAALRKLSIEQSVFTLASKGATEEGRLMPLRESSAPWEAWGLAPEYLRE